MIIHFALKWFVSQTPYLIHEHTKAPHITSCRVLLVVKCLMGQTMKASHITCYYTNTSGAVHLTGTIPP